MAKRRKGLTDDVSLDVKLTQGAAVQLKVKNLRTGAVKLISFSIIDLFETNDSEAESRDLPKAAEISPSKDDTQLPESKFTGNEAFTSDEVVDADASGKDEGEVSGDD